MSTLEFLGGEEYSTRSEITLREIKMNKPGLHRRKGKKLTHKPLPAVLNLSKKGPNQPDIVKVIAALRKGK
jgi:hypothetical protein